VFFADFEGELEERETWDCKGGNFRVECLCSEVLLGWETL
jgi:hypothetical protein